MNATTGKYAGDQLFHAISHENDPTTVQFMYLTHHIYPVPLRKLSEDLPHQKMYSILQCSLWVIILIYCLDTSALKHA